MGMDYPTLAKYGFLLGVAMFAIGGVGETAGTALYGELPGWLGMLFFDLEALGIVTGLFSPIIFGVALPLTE